LKEIHVSDRFALSGVVAQPIQEIAPSIKLSNMKPDPLHIDFSGLFRKRFRSDQKMLHGDPARDYPFTRGTANTEA
jgi:hypothetical protein